MKAYKREAQETVKVITMINYWSFNVSILFFFLHPHLSLSLFPFSTYTTFLYLTYIFGLFRFSLWKGFILGPLSRCSPSMWFGDLNQQPISWCDKSGTPNSSPVARSDKCDSPNAFSLTIHLLGHVIGKDIPMMPPGGHPAPVISLIS